MLRFIKQVWSLVRRFDQPQKYKPFVSRCVAKGNLEIGSLREVDVKSGLPATTSTERLELLDDDQHIFSVRIIGGDHRLKVYQLMLAFLVEFIYYSVIDVFPQNKLISIRTDHTLTMSNINDQPIPKERVG